MSDQEKAAFEFDRVTVARAGRPVLDEITASIPAAGITVVSGPSGAGKTLLRLCNRLEIPGAGAVSYRGQPLDEFDPLVLRRRVGMVFQRPAPFPRTVADNLAVARPDAGTAEMSAALDRVALDPGPLGQEARTLSGGELQRVCLARTLVTGPETPLLDCSACTSSRSPAAPWCRWRDDDRELDDRDRPSRAAADRRTA